MHISYSILTLLLAVFFYSNATAQKKDSRLTHKVDSLVAIDQSYRQALSDLYDQYYETNVGHVLQSRRAHAVMKHEIKNDSLLEEYTAKKDSIMDEMQKVDRRNIHALELLIKQYGYPGKKLVGHYEADKLLLHSSYEWIKKMFPILKEEVLKGNLRAITLASAYDKFSEGSGYGYLYHVLFFVDTENKITQTTPTNLEKTNKARAELGLKPIKINKHGQRKN